MLLEGLYEIVELGESECSILLAEETHPIFQAHFEGNPLLPAFVHIEIIQRLFSLEIREIKKAKLSEIVRASSLLRYTKEGKKVRVSCQNKEVASFTIV